MMNDRWKELFGSVRAEEDLKARTRAFLAEKTRGYAGGRVRRPGLPLCAAACACLLLFFGGWSYFTPTAQISIDINPSIELGINRFDRVVTVAGFNEEGEKLSDTLDVRHQDYAAAVERLLEQETIAALLSDDEVMTITVIGPDGAQTGKLLSGIRACAAGQHNTYCYFAPPEEAAAAHELGLSCGKYRAFSELHSLDPSVTAEAARGMTMREIRDRIDCLSHGGETGAGEWPGHHGGHGRGPRYRGGSQ